MSSTTETLADVNDLLSAHSALVTRIRVDQSTHRSRLRALSSPPRSLLALPLLPSPFPSPSPSPPGSRPPSPPTTQKRPLCHHENFREKDPRVRSDLPMEKRVRLARYRNYIPEEETFRNDYSQRYVDSGEWPQNFVLGAELERRFEEYPKQQRLLHLKRLAVQTVSLPPHFLPLTSLRRMPPSKFDVILIDPPYHSPSFSWQALQKLPVPQLASDPSFLFMWVGSGAGEGLEKGREVMSLWGYRRCEDVVWVKTNTSSNLGPGTDPPTSSLLTRTKQHCLMGIRGTVRRSTDNWFVHCNIDTDVIIWEGDSGDPTRKPPEMYALIESFCLGGRRLEIFGRRRPQHPLRRGWVTVLLPDDGDVTVFNLERDLAAKEENDAAEEKDSRASSVAGADEDEEKEGNNEIVKMKQEDIFMSENLPDERTLEGLQGAVLWERDKWEKDIREKCGVPLPSGVPISKIGGPIIPGLVLPFGGRVVVPSTSEIDALRPKSPVRGGFSTQSNSNNHHHGANNTNNLAGPPAVPMPLNMMNHSPMHMSMNNMGMPMNTGGGMNMGFSMGNNMMNVTPMHHQLPMRPSSSIAQSASSPAARDSPSSLNVAGNTMSSTAASTPMMRLGPGVMQNQMMGLPGMGIGMAGMGSGGGLAVAGGMPINMNSMANMGNMGNMNMNMGSIGMGMNPILMNQGMIGMSPQAHMGGMGMGGVGMNMPMAMGMMGGGGAQLQRQVQDGVFGLGPSAFHSGGGPGWPGGY